MEPKDLMPPNPQQAILRKIYPWGKYDATLIMQWLFYQAQKSGFIGTFDDFKLRYGAYMEATDPQDIYNLIENYKGAYRINPSDERQILETKNKVLNYNIIVEPIPTELINQEVYNGNYSATPMAHIAQILRTQGKILLDDVVVEEIPYAEVSNEAGGHTVTIG